MKKDKKIGKYIPGTQIPILNEKILYEWLSVNLQALEDENDEVNTQYHTMLRDFKEEEKTDQERIKEYGKEIGDLLKE